MTEYTGDMDGSRPKDPPSLKSLLLPHVGVYAFFPLTALSSVDPSLALIGRSVEDPYACNIVKILSKAAR